MKQRGVSNDGVFVKLTLAELAKSIGAEVAGDPARIITGAATLEEAGASDVSFLSNPKYEPLLRTTRAGAVIVAANLACDHLSLLRTPDPYLAFAKAVVALHGYRRHPHDGIHPRAFVDQTATIGPGTVLYPGAYVGPGTQIGRDCILYPNAVVYDNCIIGDRVIIHAGATIGNDGFGFATSRGIHHKIPQVGNVRLEDDVEIGANSAIQRAAMGSTVISKGTKVDSLVSIGHGTRVGEHGLLVSQVGIAGSTTIGHHVILGGQVGVAGHLKVGNNVVMAAQGGIISDVKDNEILQGSPGMPINQSRRVHVIFRKLPELAQRVRQLEKEMAELLKKKEDTPTP